MPVCILYCRTPPHPALYMWLATTGTVSTRFESESEQHRVTGTSCHFRILSMVMVFKMALSFYSSGRKSACPVGWINFSEARSSAP